MKPRIRVKAWSRPYTAEVVILDVATSLDIPADLVLVGALESALTHVVVLGYDMDGDEFFASSIADCSQVLWLVEKFKRQLLNMSAPSRQTVVGGGEVIPFERPAP